MFRIEYVLPRYADIPNLWRWSVKVPNGLYETLTANDEGRGFSYANLQVHQQDHLFSSRSCWRKMNFPYQKM